MAFWGTVKEVGVDDEGLLEFYQNFFTYPLYRDTELQIFKAFGSRKIGLTTWNPIRLWKGYKEMGKRLKDKQIEGNLIGEGMIMGGVLVFDARGELKYAYEEDIGEPFELADIRAAVTAVVLKNNKEPSNEEL